MTLESTGIPDKRGAALYLLHDGTLTQEKRLEEIKRKVVQHRPTAHVLVLSVKTREGERLRDFYDLAHERMPHVLIVADDDQLLAHYGSHDIPTADQLAYQLSSMSA